MEKFKILILLKLAVLTIVSCESDEIVKKELTISDERIAQFESLDFDVSNIKMVESLDPSDPTAKVQSFLLENDIVINEEALDEMLQAKNSSDNEIWTEQYRTNNLVSSPRTLKVVGLTCYVMNGMEGLDSQMQQALTMAVQNYNNLNIGLNFTLSFSCASMFNLSQVVGANDIVVYKVGGPGGGQAGFPSGGDPYKYVEIHSGTTQYGLDVLEHVITHEIGHCLGLRHTDYFNRSLSCGQGGNEGQAGVGAVHIPGTPTGFDSNSVMLSCFNQFETGEFGANDIIALEHLY